MTRFMVVDDDRRFAELVAEMLAAPGWVIAHFDDPTRALEVSAAAPPDVLFVDLHMPGMGGLELANRIRDASPDTQVVVLTGDGSVEMAVEGIHHRVFDYIEKNKVDAHRLTRVAREAASRGAIEKQNRRLTASLQETNRMLQGLHDISATLAADPHQDRVLAKLVAAARATLGATKARATLLSRTHSGEMLVEAAAGDGADTVVGMRLRPGEGLLSLAIEGDVPLVTDVAAEHPRYAKRCDDMATALPMYGVFPFRHGSGVLGVLTVAGRASGVLRAEDRDLLASLVRYAAVAVDNARQHERALNFFTHTSDMLVNILDHADTFSPGHSRAVAALADMTTRRLGLPDDERRAIHFAALLHDIGKVLVSPSVMRGDWSKEGAALAVAMREHPVHGALLLKPITMWEDILPAVQHHHERWDGAGYPLGQAGEQIPLGARIIAVADAFDAMTRDRPDGRTRTRAEAIVELEGCAGTQFDPRIVRLFVAAYRERGHLIGG